MKQLKLSLIGLCAIGLNSVWAVGSTESILGAFQSTSGDPAYVKPFASIATSAFNAGWVQSAKISDDFHWKLGLPLSFSFFGSDEHNKSNGLPTYFGDTTTNNALSATLPYTSKGYNNSLSMMPLFAPELAIGQAGFEGRLRLMGMPSMSFDGQSVGFFFFGLGAQQQFNRYINPYLSSPLPVDIGLAGHFTYGTASWQPQHYNGTLDLSSDAWGLDLVLGKTWDAFEAFSTIGYEAGSVTGKGSLNRPYLNSAQNEFSFADNQTVDARNGFKMSIGVDYTIKSSGWKPGIALSFGQGLPTISFDIFHN